MPDIRSAEWRRYNEPTKYPFADEATLVNDAGVFLPETLFIDAILYPVGGREQMYLSRVTVTSETATVWIGDVDEPQRARARRST